jgi:hypothetical protein
MKLRKSRPSVAFSIGCMMVVSVPNRPDHSPANTTLAASASSSNVMTILLSPCLRLANACTPEDGHKWTQYRVLASTS